MFHLFRKIGFALLIVLVSASTCFGAIRINDEGSLVGYVNVLDFIGAGVVATRSGITGNITLSINSLGTNLSSTTTGTPATWAAFN